jgi:type IV secretory pathway VirB2 component (pilin)
MDPVQNYLAQVAGPVAVVMAVAIVWLAKQLAAERGRVESLNADLRKAYGESIAADVSLRAVLEALTGNVKTAGADVTRDVVAEATKTRAQLGQKIDHLRDHLTRTAPP